MDPARLALMIPILALCIPIVAILANAWRKRGQAHPIQERKIQELEAKVRSLEQTVSVLSDSVLQLEDRQDFVNRLLDEQTDSQEH